MKMKLSQDLLFLCFFVAIEYSGAQMQCPGIASRCYGCDPGSMDILCSGARLSDFPPLPVAIQSTVERLVLTGNSITSIEAADLQNFTNLESLNLQDNDLESIEPGSFSATPSLEILNLQSNRLTEIPDNLFVATPALRNLDLSRNNIQNISAATFNGLSILPVPSINLNDNAIRSIPNGTFSNYRIINSLILTNNPFRCDCDLRWFPNFINSTQIGMAMYGSCDVPAGLNGRSLDSLMEEDFVCDCTPNCVNGTCDVTVGECVCEDGFIGQDCSIPCQPGRYGAGCEQNCTCVPEQEFSPCDPVNGTCHCLPGYTGESCERECPEGFYGQDCLEECQCQNNASCDFITGFCSCTSGYTGQSCNVSCPPGRYGAGCEQNCTCVPEQESSPCDPVNGTCHCLPGYTGESCERECPEGSYGQNCLGVCQCQNGASCHAVTGMCNCTAGWQGPSCNISCEDGRYGQNCQQNCRCVNEHQTMPCNKMDGSCNCRLGYKGQRCEVHEVRQTTQPINTATTPNEAPTETTLQVSEQPFHTTSAGIVVGASIAAVLLISIAIVLIAIVVIAHAFARHNQRVVPLTPMSIVYSRETLVEDEELEKIPVTNASPPPSYEQVVQEEKN